MAKPIRATPTLNKDESIVFIKRMASVEKRQPTKIEKLNVESKFK